MNIRELSHYIKKEPLIQARMNTAKTFVNGQADDSYEGAGIGIAVLDTGISLVDDFLQPRQRIAAFRDFVNGKTTPYDDNGHGTHVTYGSTSKRPFPIFLQTKTPRGKTEGFTKMRGNS